MALILWNLKQSGKQKRRSDCTASKPSKQFYHKNCGYEWRYSLPNVTSRSLYILSFYGRLK